MIDLFRFRPRIEALCSIYERRRCLSAVSRYWVANMLDERIQPGGGNEQLLRLKQRLDDEAALIAITERLTT